MSKEETDEARAADIQVVINSYSNDLPIVAAGVTSQYDRAGLLRIVADMSRMIQAQRVGKSIPRSVRHLRAVPQADYFPDETH